MKLRKLQGLTVQELIDELSHQDPEALVVFAVDYGDYNHTMQALPVNGVETALDRNEYLKASAYSRSEVALEELEDLDEAELNELEPEEHRQALEERQALEDEMDKVVVLSM